MQDRAWQELAGAGLEGRAGMGDRARMGLSGVTEAKRKVLGSACCVHLQI